MADIQTQSANSPGERAEGRRMSSAQRLLFGSSARDPRQRIRLERFFMACGRSLLVVFLFGAGWMSGFLAGRALAAGAGAIALALCALSALFRTGLNLRFSEPSLTFPQIMVSVLVTS